MNRLLPLTALAALSLTASASAATTTLRLDGIGPLKLGMTRTAAVKTGWLSRRTTGCELGGKPYPISYRLEGSKAPSGLVANAEFNGKTQRLEYVTSSKGVRTQQGIAPGVSTPAQMKSAYAKLSGFHAASAFDTTFQGTFVNVVQGTEGDIRIAGFASKGHKTLDVIGVPGVPACE